MPNNLDAFERLAHSGRLGQPVFLRCHIASPPEQTLPRLAEALAAAAAVLDDVPLRLQARGDPPSGSLHALLLFQSGATVLVCTGLGEEGADVVLLGNHGAAYYPGPPRSHLPWGEGCSAPSALEMVDRFREAIRRSLATRQPVPWEAGSDA